MKSLDSHALNSCLYNYIFLYQELNIIKKNLGLVLRLIKLLDKCISWASIEKIDHDT